MPFPILRTPFVVLSEIISLLEPNEIVCLFLLQKLETSFEKALSARKTIGMEIIVTAMDSFGRVDIVTSEDREPITVLLAKHISEFKGRKLKKLTNEYSRAFSSECPAFYFNNQVLGTKTIVDYVTRLFNLDVYGLLADRKGIRAIDWISNRQEKLLGVIALNKNPNDSLNGDETMDYVLRNARASDGLGISDNVSEHFQFDGKLGPAEHLLIEPYGHWVTFNNLMNFDFINIGIKGSRLSVTDLFSFLRHWRAGGSSRLTFLFLRFENDITFFENFDEDLEVVETNEVGRYRLSANADREFVIEGGYSIRRIDGVKATIQWNFGWFRMVVWHERATEQMNSSNEVFKQL